MYIVVLKVRFLWLEPSVYHDKESTLLWACSACCQWSSEVTPNNSNTSNTPPNDFRCKRLMRVCEYCHKVFVKFYFYCSSTLWILVTLELGLRVVYYCVCIVCVAMDAHSQVVLFCYDVCIGCVTKGQVTGCVCEWVACVSVPPSVNHVDGVFHFHPWPQSPGG